MPCCDSATTGLRAPSRRNWAPLPGLRTLNLENNALTGEIPWELGELEGLVSLRLGNNELNGVRCISSAWPTCAYSRRRTPGLTGEIHPRLGNLWRLEELRLDNNRLYGRFPEELDWLDRLAVLRLGGNAFHDCLPAASRAARTRDNDLESADLLCESSPGSKLDLFEDGVRLMRVRDILAGDAVLNWSYARPVSSWQGVSIGSTGRVVGLELRNLNLTGRIPPELGELNHLYVLRLDGNRLTGPIPPELGNLTRLFLLSLDGNRLTGPIPPELANLSNIGQLSLADNRLTGSIPPELAEIERITLAVAVTISPAACRRSCSVCAGTISMIPPSALSGRGTDCCSGNWVSRRPWRRPSSVTALTTLEHMDGAPVGNRGRPLGVHNV